jgi:hypothetical protein
MMKQKKTKRGRPESPARDLARLKLKMPQELRDRLTAQAAKETIASKLGLVKTAGALAVEILDEGLTRREVDAPLNG